MAGIAPRSPEQFRDTSHDLDFNVSELISDAAGAHSPFGEQEFPLPASQLRYSHPQAAERPKLAGGR